MPLNKLAKTLVAAALAALSGQVAPARAAGTIPLAMVQQFDSSGAPMAGCILSFYAAGTVASPQNSYSDFGLSQNPLPSVTCDQSGRLPMFWLADGLIHIRLTDSTGLQVLDTTMQVLGPSSGGGGGGGTVDPTTIAQTGDIKLRRDKSPITGWVRVNGLTIGNATSGATERANADTQALFTYIWTNFSQPSGNVICAVVGGLGANALADYNASKQITLDDTRARSMFGYDDMGNSPLGGFAGVTFTYGSGTTVGGKGGVNSTTLLPAWIPTITSNGTFALSAGDILNSPSHVDVAGFSGGGGANVWTAWPSGTSIVRNTVTASGSVTSNNTGAGAMPTVPSAFLVTMFWKL